MADSDIFGDDSIQELDNETLWVNLLMWLTPGDRGKIDVNANSVTEMLAWQELVAAIETLRPLQNSDGSINFEVANIDQVVVGMGPGPFTGLRVGISFAQSFALARGIALRGVCSLDAIDVDQSHYTVGLDARRHEIYWARYKDGVRIEGPSVSKPSEVLDCVTGFFPQMTKLVRLSEIQNVTEPMYLRRPDAIPTADRT